MNCSILAAEFEVVSQNIIHRSVLFGSARNKSVDVVSSLILPLTNTFWCNTIDGVCEVVSIALEEQCLADCSNKYLFAYGPHTRQ